MLVSQDRCGKQDCGVTQILVEVSNLFSVQVFSKLPHRTFSGLVRRIHYSWEWNFLCRFGLQPERLFYCSSSDRSACRKSALHKPALVVLSRQACSSIALRSFGSTLMLSCSLRVSSNSRSTVI